MNPYKDWKTKLESAHSFKVQSDRITVCRDLFRLAQKNNFSSFFVPKVNTLAIIVSA